MDAAQERLAQLSRTQQALLAKIQALEEQEQGAPPPPPWEKSCSRWHAAVLWRWHLEHASSVDERPAAPCPGLAAAIAKTAAVQDDEDGEQQQQPVSKRRGDEQRTRG